MKSPLIWFLSLALFVFVRPAEAQQPGKIFRIGFLHPSTASGMAVVVDAFRQELSNLGWIEGKNIATEYRFSAGRDNRLPELAAELARLKVDLMVVVGTTAATAAKNATTRIPIVFTNSGDPVGAGLVASLARPGGNLTGLASLSIELNTKRLEVLKDAVPNCRELDFSNQRGGSPQGQSFN